MFSAYVIKQRDGTPVTMFTTNGPGVHSAAMVWNLRQRQWIPFGGVAEYTGVGGSPDLPAEQLTVAQAKAQATSLGITWPPPNMP